MTLESPTASTPSAGVEASLPAAAVTRCNEALAMGYEADPARQSEALGNLYGFKQDLARTVNGFYQARGDHSLTPGAAAYRQLVARSGLQPGDPNMGYALAALTGMA